ncbi:MAG: alpha/beta fold hydrolase [Myxococcales bacterium]|nr:alpha/beta fold hydrolase [Myxococcales bacterium]
MSSYAARMPTTDIYVVDHRGTGHSHRLTCPAQDEPAVQGGYYLDPALVPSCLAHLESNGDAARLPFFTSAQAARDVAFAIEHLRRPGQTVTVLGGSYGTHWAHRLLQVAPGAADRFVFDGFMTPGRFAFRHDDRGIEEVGVAFAAACTNDAACSTAMGPDPFAAATQILADLESTPCGPFDAVTARLWASIFLDGGPSRVSLFPMLHRLERCSAIAAAQSKGRTTKSTALATRCRRPKTVRPTMRRRYPSV